MMDGLKQEITLYHKTKDGYKKYVLIAFIKATAIENRNNTGVSSTDSALARIFVKDNEEYQVDLGDVVVNDKVTTEIKDINAPLTELQKAYGKHNVFKVTNIDRLIYKDADLEELNHIKLGLV